MRLRDLRGALGVQNVRGLTTDTVDLGAAGFGVFRG